MDHRSRTRGRIRGTSQMVPVRCGGVRWRRRRIPVRLPRHRWCHRNRRGHGRQWLGLLRRNPKIFFIGDCTRRFVAGKHRDDACECSHCLSRVETSCDNFTYAWILASQRLQYEWYPSILMETPAATHVLPKRSYRSRGLGKGGGQREPLAQLSQETHGYDGCCLPNFSCF